MQRHLDEELKILNTSLLTMATLTEEAIHKSLEALRRYDVPLAKTVIVEDKRIDDWENKIEEHTIELLALFQPMARDLRFITTGMRINTELERMADLTVNICQRIRELEEASQSEVLADISQLGENAKWMVKNAIDAFVRRDQELATKVIFSDDASNDLRTKVMERLKIDIEVKTSYRATSALLLILVTRDLERICDHAKYIAEDVIYMIQAKLVKHHIDELTRDNEAEASPS